MPIMVTLSDAVRKKDSAVSLELTTNFLHILQDTFEFNHKSIEVWENETSRSLGGKLVEKVEIKDEKLIDETFVNLTDQLLKSNILIIRGEIKTPKKLDLWVQFNIWSNVRKVYSDVFIDTSPEEKDTIIDVFWTERGQSLAVDFISKISHIRTAIDGKKHKTVVECIISPLVDDASELEVDGLVGFYSSKAKPYYLLKRIISNLIKYSDSATNYREKLDLINLDKLSRKIYELGIVRNKFEVIDKRVVPISIGSTFFKARDRESFKSFVEDVKKQIVEPSLEPLDYEKAILTRIETNLKKWNVQSLDEN